MKYPETFSINVTFNPCYVNGQRQGHMHLKHEGVEFEQGDVKGIVSPIIPCGLAVEVNGNHWHLDFEAMVKAVIESATKQERP